MVPKSTATAMPTTPTTIPEMAPASRCPPPDEPVPLGGAELAEPGDVGPEDVGAWVIHSQLGRPRVKIDTLPAGDPVVGDPPADAVVDAEAVAGAVAAAGVVPNCSKAKAQ